MAGMLVICPATELLVFPPMSGTRNRVVYEGNGNARDASEDQKTPPPPPRWMKNEDCFHGKYPTTRSLTRHDQPFPGTPAATDQSKLLQLRGLKKHGLKFWSKKVAKD